MPNLHKFETVWTIKIVIALPLKQRNKQTNNLDFPILSGGSTFEIGHFEVWGLGPQPQGLGPQPQAEEERAKVEVRKPDLDIEDGGNVDMNDLMGQIC